MVDEVRKGTEARRGEGQGLRYKTGKCDRDLLLLCVALGCL
jgi:hypothetical protein